MTVGKPEPQRLSRREREIMDAIYRLGKATASDVYAELQDPPSDTSVRKLIRILESKGHLTHARRGREHVYAPTIPKARARRDALVRLVTTFFDGSPVEAAAALLRDTTELSGEDVARLSELIERAARDGR